MARPEATTAVREQEPRKERMGDHELGNLLAALGNHEGKALLSAAMVRRKVYADHDVHQLVISKQGDRKVWGNIDHGTTSNWFRGLAAYNDIGTVLTDPNDGTILGYQKNKYGEEIGDAFVGHFLTFSETYPETSLYQLNGSTMSNSKPLQGEGSYDEAEFRLRSPLTRFRIFSQLLELAKERDDSVEQLPIREVDLLNALRVAYPNDYSFGDEGKGKQSITNHLQSLSQNNVLTYDSAESEKAYSFYQLSKTPAEVPPASYKTQKKLTERIYSVLLESPESILSSQDLYERLTVLYPEYVDISRNGFGGRISSVLVHLKNGGYIKHVGKFKSDYQSEIELSSNQRQLLTEYVVLIEKFKMLDPQFLEEGRVKAAQIVEDPQRFSALLEKAKNTSPMANASRSEETKNNLRTIIATSPGITRRGLQRLYFQEHGKHLSTQRICTLLLEMRKEEDEEKKIYVEKKGSTHCYSESPIEPEPNLPPEAVVYTASDQ
ncbi:MAG TPA: hypothetical protein VNA13_05050 [Xanthomonadales bacterium]|nr:hypothetical protein [Xanthomonadales bacterium]